MNHSPGTSPRRLAYTLAMLLLLAGVSLFFRFVRLGDYGFPVALGIAALKALLVVVFFMELPSEKASVRIAFVTGLTLFALLLVFVVADVLTRSAPSLDAPPGNARRYRG